MHAAGFRSPSKILDPDGAGSSSALTSEKKKKTLFLRAWLLPPAPPSHICIYFERRVRLSLFINCSSWADPTHSWALAAGSAFPASRSRSLAKRGSGLTARTQETGCTEGGWAGPRREAGLLVASGIQKWVTGGDWVCFPYCCSPWVSRKMFLVRQC